MALHLIPFAVKAAFKNLQKTFVFKRFISFIIPVPVRRASGTHNALLELYMYRGRWQLATDDALYSDGARYVPLVAAYKKIKSSLPAVKNVLLLGTGLGSAVSVMRTHKVYPRFTLVEIDEVVLQWALECLQGDTPDQLVPVCMDAGIFIGQDNNKYDMLIVDIFAGRVVPAFALDTEFLKKCRQRLNEGGHFIMNYIINNKDEWNNLQTTVNSIYPSTQVVDLGLNRVIIATA